MRYWHNKHSYYFSYIKNSRLRLRVAPIDARGLSFWFLLTVPAGHLCLYGISTSDIVVGVWKILRNASEELQRPQMFSRYSSRLRKQWQVTLHLKYSGMRCCGPSFLGLFFFFYWTFDWKYSKTSNTKLIICELQFRNRAQSFIFVTHVFCFDLIKKKTMI